MGFVPTVNSESAYPTGIEESLNNAGVDAKKAALGIVQDSLEVSLTQYTADKWSVSTDASKPTLHPMLTLRMGAEEELEDTSWQAFYADLLEVLTPSERKMIENDHPEYVVLKGLLKQFSMAIAHMEEVISEEISTDEQKEMRIRQLIIGQFIAQQACKQAEEVDQIADIYMPYLGANDTHFDAIVLKKNELKMLYAGLSKDLSEE